MARVDTSYPYIRERHRLANLEALGGILADVADDVSARYDAGAKVLLAKRWDAAIRSVLLARNTATASEIAMLVANALGNDDYDPAVMNAWLAINARIGAENITDSTREHLDGAESAEEVEAVLEELQTSRASMYALSMVTAMAGFAAKDAADKAGAAVKVWRTNSTHPRSAHARLNGQSVALGERFSNGMDWPGDFEGGADEVANCKCSMTIVS